MPNQTLPDKIHGPFLAAAFFCERTIEDGDDKTITAVRIVDTVSLQLHPAAFKDGRLIAGPILTPISALISFKSGNRPGPHQLRLVVETPSGKKMAVFDHPIELTDKFAGGFNFRLNSTLAVTQSGMYLINVYLSGRLMSRMPLMVSLEPAEVNPPQTSSEQKPSSRRRKRRPPTN